MWEVHSGARWLVAAGERRNWNSSDNGKHLGQKDGGEKLRAKTGVLGGHKRASVGEGTRQGPLEDGPVRGKPSEEVTQKLRPVGKGAAEGLRGVRGGEALPGSGKESRLSLRNGRLPRAF